MSNEKRALIIITFLLVLGSCGEKKSYPSVSSITGEWLAIKIELSTPADGIGKKIENFRSTLDRFFDSPVGSLYKVHRPDEIKSLADMGNAAERLQIAVLNGEK